MRVRPSTISTTAVAAALVALAGCSSGGGSGSAGAESTPKTGMVIESFTPSSDVSAVAGEDILFSVSMQEEEAIEYRWSVDGVEQDADTAALIIGTSTEDASVHTVSVEMRSADSQYTSIVWRLRLRPGSAGDSNEPPAITSALPASRVYVQQGGTVSMSVQASDPDAADTIAYRWFVDGVPDESRAASFALDTSSLAIGDHFIEATASDGRDHGPGGIASHTFSVTVRSAPVGNRAPAIESTAPAASVRIAAGSTLSLSVKASDPDGDPLRYRWTVDGSMQAGTSSSFSYAATAAAAGSHTISVRVDDGIVNIDASDPTFAWTVTVDAPAPPPPPPPPPDSPSDPPETPIDPPPPPAPLVAVQVMWDPVATDVLGNPETVAGYRVYLSTVPGDFDLPVAVVAAPEADLYDLAPGTTYHVAVTAFDAEGNESTLSEAVSFAIE